MKYMVKYILNILHHGNISNFNSSNYNHNMIINEVISYLMKLISLVLAHILDLLIFVLRPLYLILLIIGVIIYAASGLSPRKRRYLYGGVVLAIFTELILPLILNALHIPHS